MPQLKRAIRRVRRHELEKMIVFVDYENLDRMWWPRRRCTAPTAARRRQADLTGMLGLSRWRSLASYPIRATFPGSIAIEGATA